MDGEVVPVGCDLPIQHASDHNDPGAWVDLKLVRNPGQRVTEVAVSRPYVLVDRRYCGNLGTDLGTLKA